MQQISGSLAPGDRDILAVKYQAARISNLPAEDVPKHAKGLLFRIHTITGWKLPDDDLFLNTLVSEFSKYLVESCLDLNPEEISFAVRNYGIGIQDWGKSMNLSLINEPIEKYRIARSEISKLEEIRKNAIPAIQNSPENEKPADWSEEWNQVKESAKNGQIENAFIPIAIYYWLNRNKILELTAEDKWELFSQARTVTIAKLQNLISEGTASRLDVDFCRKLSDPNWQQDDRLKTRIANEAKVLAVKQLAMLESLE